MALTLGQLAPDFMLESHLGKKVHLGDYRGNVNVVLIFFPQAWTRVWTSQIPSYQVALNRFDGMQAQVLGLSVDSIPTLKAWSESMGGIGYPLLSDFYPHGQVAQMYGVLRPNGTAERAIYIIDKQGVIRYVDVHDAGQQPDNEVLFAELARINGVANAQPAPQPEIALADEPDADIVMYCTPWCSDCRKAREYLNFRNIPYVEVDITRDLAGAQRMRSWTGGKQITPTFNIRGTIIIDFDKPRLAEVLGIKE